MVKESLKIIRHVEKRCKDYSPKEMMLSSETETDGVLGCNVCVLLGTISCRSKA